MLTRLMRLLVIMGSFMNTTGTSKSVLVRTDVEILLNSTIKRRSTQGILENLSEVIQQEQVLELETKSIQSVKKQQWFSVSVLTLLIQLPLFNPH